MIGNVIYVEISIMLEEKNVIDVEKINLKQQCLLHKVMDDIFFFLHLKINKSFFLFSVNKMCCNIYYNLR